MPGREVGTLWAVSVSLHSPKLSPGVSPFPLFFLSPARLSAPGSAPTVGGGAEQSGGARGEAGEVEDFGKNTRLEPHPSRCYVSKAE